jgi:nitroimidazol reductase NimA-like FMN-containing flavoprotein (pyridoxamine 5'-phosphate oxidase superfamily)
MLIDLDKKQIIDLLQRQVIGRLGCHANDETYIIPINYVYRNDSIYAHSGNGKKIEMMRINPKVCFQVDETTDTFRWQSVILWGTFEELNGEDRQQAMQGIIQRIMPLTNRPSEDASHGIDVNLHNNLIVYRIRITEGTGRSEFHEG